MTENRNEKTCHGCRPRAITAVRDREYYCPECQSTWSLRYGDDDG